MSAISQLFPASFGYKIQNIYEILFVTTSCYIDIIFIDLYYLDKVNSRRLIYKQ